MKTIDKFIQSRTTGIGSLPHHNIDTALDFSFKFGIPFLPQIPIRNPWEFMIPQALEGLQGLDVDKDGSVNLHLEIWKSRAYLLDQKLEKAFAQSEKEDAFESFEPSSSTLSCWQPFLWELEERRVTTAKVQLAGPMTSQWALRIKEGSSSEKTPELGQQVFKLILARALSMTSRMIKSGIKPILFIDEPGLFAFSPESPQHLLCLSQLKVMVQTLKRKGALVGLHCCSQAHWRSIFELGLDYLSIDATLSLAHALSIDNGKAMEQFILDGGKLSLGVIPTSLPLLSAQTQSLTGISWDSSPEEISKDLEKNFLRVWEGNPDLIHKVLSEALFTPACGLALLSTSESELVLEKLMETYAFFASK